MAVKKAATKKVAPKVEVTEEGFLLLIVFKMTHGGLFSKHSHYSTSLLKVKDAEMAKSHTRAAKQAAEIMSESGAKCELIISERVDALDQDQMRAQIDAKLSKLGGLGEILKNL